MLLYASDCVGYFSVSVVSWMIRKTCYWFFLVLTICFLSIHMPSTDRLMKKLTICFFIYQRPVKFQRAFSMTYQPLKSPSGSIRCFPINMSAHSAISREPYAPQCHNILHLMLPNSNLYINIVTVYRSNQYSFLTMNALLDFSKVAQM